MEIKGKVHCFFEQSGTFKNEFIKTNCLTCGECKNGFKFEQCGYNDILELIIQENEK